MTRKMLSIVTVTMVILLAAGVLAFGGKPTKPPAIEYVELDVTIECTDGGNICDDLDGEYVNGVDGVGGGLDVAGNLNFNFSVNSPGAGVSSRQVWFDFDSPTVVLDEPLPATDTYYAVIRSAPAADEYCPIQNMSEGQYQFVQLGWALYTEAIYPRWRLQFHNGDADGDDSTSYALVSCTTAVDEKCSEWLVVPSQTPSLNSALLVEVAFASGKGGRTTVTKKGYFDMPFRLTLKTHQP